MYITVCWSMGEVCGSPGPDTHRCYLDILFLLIFSVYFGLIAVINRMSRQRSFQVHLLVTLQRRPSIRRCQMMVRVWVWERVNNTLSKYPKFWTYPFQHQQTEENQNLEAEDNETGPRLHPWVPPLISLLLDHFSQQSMVQTDLWARSERSSASPLYSHSVVASHHLKVHFNWFPPREHAFLLNGCLFLSPRNALSDCFFFPLLLWESVWMCVHLSALFFYPFPFSFSLGFVESALASKQSNVRSIVNR